MPLTDLNFYSGYAIDKIVYENTDSPLTYSVGNGATSTQSVTNPFGAKCFITMSWSIDGTNYYPAQGIIPDAAYSNGTTANAWVDSSSVYIYMENNSGGTKTFSIIFALDTIT